MATNVSAVLFAKDSERLAEFYRSALGMSLRSGDEHHAVLDCGGFELVVHRISPHVAANIVIDRPPKRRVTGAIRLDFPVRDVAASRAAARSLGGDIDDVPPAWAAADANFFFGYDPEGNQFGVSESTR
jgi:predicted enzyme related to lactoylglutathione lyase